MDYTIFYKTSFDDAQIDDKAYDYFFSGFDDCERTTKIFNQVNATKKFWIHFPHYGIEPPEEDLYKCDSFKEDECFIQLFVDNNFDAKTSVCIDSSGFLRPHLLFLLVSLHRRGIRKIDVLYTEPQYYKHAEDTRFSGFIDEVRLVEGCGSSVYFSNTDNDILIATAGYDDKLVAKVSQFKSKIRKKYYIFGFPSLQADMYQESVLKLFQAKESIGNRIDKYAPAHDPFVTAQVISEIVDEAPSESNIYLSPLSTKPQTIGIALYYIWNRDSKALNIIFPFSNKYFAKTAIGIKRTWRYHVELP